MFDDPNVEDYIARKGWEIFKKEQGKNGEHIILKICPLCGSHSKGAKRRFYINVSTGLWNTYCCGKTGNIITLKKSLGDLDFMQQAPFIPATTEGAKLAEKINKLRRSKESRWEGFNIPPKSSAPLYHHRLMNGEAEGALEYLTKERKLTEKTLKHFEIGVARRGYCNKCKKQTSIRIDNDQDYCPWCNEPISNAQEMLAIPYKVGGKVVNFKFRSLNGDKRFEKWDGGPTTLFNEDSLDSSSVLRVAICEGEIDAITMHQLGYSVVIATGGAHKKLEDEWVERLALFDDVLLAYDSDAAGDDGADKTSKQLGKYRCRRVKWPEKDPNDCLRSGISEEELKGIIEAAASYRIKAVKQFSEFTDELRKMRQDGKKSRGRDTMWLNINTLLAGMRGGEVTVVTGDTGSGKTTYTTAMAWDQSRNLGEQEGVGILIASFELKVVDVCRKLTCMEANKSFFKPSKENKKGMMEGDFEEAITRLSSRKVFFIDQYGKIPLDDLRDAIEYGVRRHGLWFVVIDHLHFFLDCDPRYERQTIDNAVRAIKEWALFLDIHIVLVVHPAKLRTDTKGNVLPPGMNDLKGSSEIKKTADNIIRVHRERGIDMPSNVPPHVAVGFLKVRSDFGQEGEVFLLFDPETLRYENCTSSELALITGSKHKKTRKKNGKAGQREEKIAIEEKTEENKTEPLFFDDDEVKSVKLYTGGRLTSILGQQDGP